MREDLYKLQLQNRWTSDVSELVAECDRIRDGMAAYGLAVRRVAEATTTRGLYP